jgi:hypothetical protein
MTSQSDNLNNNLTSKTASNPLTDFMTSYLERFRGMSWAEISYILEEEEEQEEREEAERKLQEQMAERRRLYACGEYELEDGEVLE